MSFKKKLFTAIGPLCLAFVIVAGIFLSPFRLNPMTPKVTSEAATSMGVNVIKGNQIKNKAMREENYVPFFGSSEYSRFNAFHPSVLAEKYDRNYRPFLLGAAGTQSLSQFLMLQSMSNESHGKKAVFVISPQWFVKGGVSKEMFSLYFSPLQTYQWILNVKEIDEAEVYTAKRLLKFKNVRSDTTLKSLLKQIAADEPLSTTQEKMCRMRLNVLNREDQLFGHLGLISRRNKIDKQLKKLPDTYDFNALDELAYQTGQSKTKSNSYEITDSFYKKRIMPVEASLEGAQVEFDYRKSVEFSDFQLFLSEVERLKMDVLFVIPPVNERWSDYTGLSTEMLDEFSKKINYQLRSQGFTNIADFTDKRGEDYFMEDTIHIGWRGWLEMDQSVEPFLKNRKADKKSYKIDPYFFTKEWQKLDPNAL